MSHRSSRGGEPQSARVAAARTKSEGGARSASGIVSAAAFLIGLRFEARAPPQQPLEPAATLMDQHLWAETLNVRSNGQAHVAEPAGSDPARGVDDGDDMHHRSVSEVGIQGQTPNTPTPTSTVPYGAKSQLPSMHDQNRAEDKPVSSSSLPPPEGTGQDRHSTASASPTDLRIRELEAQLAARRR